MGENPLFKKLRILPNLSVLILHAPDTYLSSLGDFPPGTKVDTEISGQYDLLHAFFTQRTALQDEIESLKAAINRGGILWISYPKQSAKQDTDLNRDILRQLLAAEELKAVSQVSIDQIWSAIRFKLL